MSDNLEKFIRNNRDAFDAQVPNNQIWANIQAGIAQQAAATAGTTTAAAVSKSGLAKIALGWKIASVVAFTAIVATGIYFAMAGNSSKDAADGKSPEPLASTTPPSSETQQAEYLYEASAMVTPPLPEANIPYLTFKVDAAKGGAWSAPTGTEIKVPGGIFVDAQGQPITGEVELRYREFHDAEDVLLSGITMKYTENGANEHFQTAGMMEILGYQGSKPVYIAQGKTLDVKMASFTPEDNYDLYYLDTKDGWKNIGKAKLSKNKQKEEGLALVATKPRPPVKGTEAEMDGEVMFNANYDKFPELRPFKGVRWMAEDMAEFKSKESQLVTKVWNDVEIKEIEEGGLRYQLTLKHKSGKTMDIAVKPILEGEEYEKGMARFREKMDRYNKLLVQKGVDEKRLATQADVFRTFTVSGFGIYNCDRYLSGSPAVSARVEYVFPEDSYMSRSTTIVYQICGENRAVITRPPGDDAVNFFPYEKNFLVVMLPNNRIGVFGPEKFSKIKGKSMNNKIEFEEKDVQVSNAADLRLALGL